MIILRPDQQALKQGVYDRWNAGDQNVVAVLPTGGGKSVVVSDIVMDRENAGARQCIMAHRNELVGQMSLHVARRGIKHRIIGSKSTIAFVTQEHRSEFGRSFVSPDARCSVGSVQTIVSRKDELKQWGAQIDDWTLDECFPAGTMITTLTGERPIETIRRGDFVLAFDDVNQSFQWRCVVRLFENPEPDTMIDISIYGRQIRCTAGHPFWTKRGWVEAINLRGDDDLFVDMRTVRGEFHHREGVYRIPSKETRDGVLLQGARLCLEVEAREKAPTWAGEAKNMSCLWGGTFSTTCENMFAGMPVTHFIGHDDSDQPKVRIGAYENTQPDEMCGSEIKSLINLKGDEPCTIKTGWEWSRNTESGADFKQYAHSIRVYPAICDQDGGTTEYRVPHMLQAGLFTPNAQDCSGGRRAVALFSKAQSTRHEKGCIFDWCRVDSIEVHKRSDHEQSCRGSVYNFEVDQLHTYIANGVVAHNCHHALRDNIWGEAIKLFTNGRGLGVTACTIRADGNGIGRHAEGVFDSMVVGPTMRELIDIGGITDYEIVIPTNDFQIAEDAVTAKGDFSPNKMREASKNSRIVGDVVQEYVKWAYGKRTIVFATDVDTANDMAARYNEVGIPAASVSAKTDPLVRRDMIRRFRDGRIWVLINVDLFDEGFDVPACECVILARPTQSLNKYLQMVGRALRLAQGKTHGLIIDMVSNWKRHTLLITGAPINQTLDRREKRAKKEPDPEDIPLTRCKECSRPYPRVLRACKWCGAEPPLPEPASRTLQQVDGDLMLLDRAKLEQMRQAMALESPGDMETRVAAVAGPVAGAGARNRQFAKIEAQGRLRAALEQWAGVRRAAGETDDMIHRRYFLATGSDMLSVMNAERKASDYERDAIMVEGWYS